jgi:DNA-binding transcriptional ArsR family regulator
MFGWLIVGAAAADVRRSLGPTAWCALEVLAASPRDQVADAWIVRSSVRDLAARMGVAKNTAQRALADLRDARLVEFAQRRDGGGRFHASTYRLAVPDAVLTPQPLQRGAAVRSSRRSEAGVGRRVAAASPAGGFEEQLVLLPLG